MNGAAGDEVAEESLVAGGDLGPAIEEPFSHSFTATPVDLGTAVEQALVVGMLVAGKETTEKATGLSVLRTAVEETFLGLRGTDHVVVAEKITEETAGLGVFRTSVEESFLRSRASSVVAGVKEVAKKSAGLGVLRTAVEQTLLRPRGGRSRREDAVEETSRLSVFGTSIEEPSLELTFGIVLPLYLRCAGGAVGGTRASNAAIAGGD